MQPTGPSTRARMLGRTMALAAALAFAITGRLGAQGISQQQGDEILKEIRKAYIDTGRLRFITRDFPLPFHPEAVRAARASRCAADQKKFWEMRSVLVQNANRLSRDFMMSSATELKLDTDAFAKCVDSDRYQAEVQKDMREGSAAGVEGTPTFVLGRTTAGSELEGVRIVGALPFSMFDDRIKALLAPAPSKP
jgi:protein-disulfide isomerase